MRWRKLAQSITLITLLFASLVAVESRHASAKKITTPVALRQDGERKPPLKTCEFCGETFEPPGYWDDEGFHENPGMGQPHQPDVTTIFTSDEMTVRTCRVAYVRMMRNLLAGSSQVEEKEK